MYYKKILYTWLSIAFSVIFIFISLYIIVDPVNILGSPVIQGLNHQKIKEGSFLDIVKPYQYLRAAPDEVYIGSSRIYVGLGPVPGDEINAYNMGFSGLSLPDMQHYIEFICETNPPKTLYVGLDFFQFGKENFNTKREGYSCQRLKSLAEHNKFKYFQWLLADALSFCNAEYLVDTIIASYKAKDNEMPLFYNGCDLRRGLSEFNNEEAQYVLISFDRQYREWELEPESIETFKEIERYLRNKNIRVYYFINPVSAELASVMHKYNHDKDFENIKGILQEVCFIKDFSSADYRGMQENIYFYDYSHYNIQIGVGMLNEIIN